MPSDDKTCPNDGSTMTLLGTRPDHDLTHQWDVSRYACPTCAHTTEEKVAVQPITLATAEIAGHLGKF